MWATPAFHKKEGATLHSGVQKHGLQYDGRLDERFGVRVGTWNLGNLSGKLGEVCEELRKRMIDVCCSHDVRWRGWGASMLWMNGKGDEVGDVGVMVKEDL